MNSNVIITQDKIQQNLIKASKKNKPFSSADIREFIQNTHSVKEELEETEDRTGIKFVKFRRHLDPTDEDTSRGKIAARLISFEINMCSIFLKEISDLNNDEEIDIRKFYFWKEILFRADLMCREAKQKFADEGFNLLIQEENIRREVYDFLIDSHLFFIKQIEIHKDLLPIKIKEALYKTLKEMPELKKEKMVEVDQYKKEGAIENLEAEIKAVEESINQLKKEHKEGRIENAFFYNKYQPLQKELILKKIKLKNFKKEAKLTNHTTDEYDLSLLEAELKGLGDTLNALVADWKNAAVDGTFYYKKRRALVTEQALNIKTLNNILLEKGAESAVKVLDKAIKSDPREEKTNEEIKQELIQVAQEAEDKGWGTKLVEKIKEHSGDIADIAIGIGLRIGKSLIGIP